jgi:ABC-type nitrate/sulfonate/bicarbonate transport system ATPase subunit
MDGLLLERVPGLPARVQIDVGEQRAVVMAEAVDRRRLADLVTGAEEPPAGVNVKAGGPVRLVPAEGGLLPHLTVLGNVMHGHRATHPVTKQAAKEQGLVKAIACGLEDVLDRYPHEITPGRRRLAGVARALGAYPRVILLEDANGLPTWGSLLSLRPNPDLASAALLLVTTSAARTTGFAHAE